MMMKVSALIFTILLTSCLVYGQPELTFSKQQVLDDLDTLRESLQETHYDIYAYTSPQAFDSTYSTIKNSIRKDSLSLLEATNLLQRLAATVHNGHTSIEFPVQSYLAYAQNGGTIFPLEIAFENGQALVRKNWSSDESIEVGDTILSMNGTLVADIVAQIYPQIAAERPYFKNTKIELYSFPRLYWQVFGQQDDFVVEIATDQEMTQHAITAVNVIEDYEMKRTEVINSEQQLTLMPSAAYLNPGPFGGDELAYQAFIDSAFTTIKSAQSKNLIIDLRNHPGGDDAFSNYLVSYLADQPFKWNAEFTLKTSRLLKKHVRKHYDTTQVFWRETLNHQDGAVYAYDFEPYSPQVPEKRFAGSVYVLVNRQSHSQAAVTAAQIQDYGFGTIVGEETGDFPSLHASIFQYQLPETGILVNVSKGYIVRVNGNTDKRGVIPDIYIKDHLLDDEDEILNGIIGRIQQD